MAAPGQAGAAGARGASIAASAADNPAVEGYRSVGSRASARTSTASIAGHGATPRRVKGSGTERATSPSQARSSRGKSA